MTEGERRRFERMVSDRPLAPLPTVEDVRLLLADIERLTQERDAAIQTCADLQLRATERTTV